METHTSQQGDSKDPLNGALHRTLGSRTPRPVVLSVALWFILFALTVAVIQLAMRGGGLPKRFAEVDPGVLLRSGQPTTRQIDNLIKTYGLKSIVIARSDKSTTVPDETGFATSHGVKVISVPIGSRSPISDEQVAQFFTAVDDLANRPMLVHCSAGRHRTGYLCALYRIERQGWSKQRAIEEMLTFGFDQKNQTTVLEQLKAYVPLRERR